MKFYKMHGIGNDYIYFDCMDGELENPSELAVRLSDRHFSIGGDGVILLCRSDIADCKMRMFNSDGSEGRMCGNGIRCIGKLASDLGYVKGDEITVETLSGVKTLKLSFGTDGKVCAAEVDMGAPILEGRKIPSAFDGEVISRPLEVGGKIYRVTLVSMGNPHCVVFSDNPEKVDLITVGRQFETHPAFPERINTEFVGVIGENRLRMRVWERGTGETLACGTGACAAAVAAVLNGVCSADKPVVVTLDGGELSITVSRKNVKMFGQAALSFVGEIEL